MRTPRPDRVEERLRVDPVACDGVGICAHLAPRLVTVDSWGYPIITSKPLDRGDRRAAALAVTGCPRHALFIDPEVVPVR